jgi:hypothetical protein
MLAMSIKDNKVLTEQVEYCLDLQIIIAACTAAVLWQNPSQTLWRTANAPPFVLGFESVLMKNNSTTSQQFPITVRHRETHLLLSADHCAHA